MSGGMALAAGAGLGLAYFGGLWLTVRLVLRPGGGKLFLISQLARMALAGTVLLLLCRSGVTAMLVGLLGFWMGRWVCLGLGGANRTYRTAKSHGSYKSNSPPTRATGGPSHA